jgi:hypothetical protein
VWSFGEQLAPKDQVIFDNVLKSLTARVLSATDPAPMKTLPSSKPILFLYFYNFKTLTFEPWNKQVVLTPPRNCLQCSTYRPECAKHCCEQDISRYQRERQNF